MEGFGRKRFRDDMDRGRMEMTWLVLCSSVSFGCWKCGGMSSFYCGVNGWRLSMSLLRYPLRIFVGDTQGFHPRLESSIS